ncbi:MULTISPECIES: YceD family protein [Halomonadaceae]|uniref:Large ribosomal RNA subunit accumulation protein YceD n=1 Tax=Modicisalibacter zincidurans TaxID=1178777 RepID=A0ABP9RJF8_9GAMM|nr:MULTISPECIES: YceD family protein [Halomonas]MCD6008845.1 YceD family protein [Halomonas sp. IOP_31]
MMSTRLPAQVEPYRLAANGQRLEGLMSLAALPRLAEEAGVQQGDCEVTLQFDLDAQGRRYIEGWLKADVQLACRRCLEPMPVAIDSHWLLGMVTSDALAATLPGDYEPVLVEDEQLDLLPVLEDEIILSLPQVVYHDEAHCAVSRDQLVSGDASETSEAAPASPFDVLRTLKDKH